MPIRSVFVLVILHLCLVVGRAYPSAPPPAQGDEPSKPQTHNRTDYYGDPLPKGAIARLGMDPVPSVYGGSDLAFTSDGKHLLTVDGDGQVRVWDAITGELLRRRRLDWKPPDATQGLERIVLSPGAGRVTAWDHQRFYVFDTATGRELARLDAVATDSRIPPLAIFAPDGKTLLIQRQTDQTAPADAYLWHLAASDERPKRTELAGLGPRSSWIRAAAFTPDGRRLFALTDGLRIWDTATGRALDGPDRAIVGAEGLGFAPDGRYLAATLWQRDKFDSTRFASKALTLRETVTGEELCRWAVGPVQFVAFTPDGRAVVTTNREGVCVWDAATGRRWHRMNWPSLNEPSTPTCWAVLPSGRLATGMAGSWATVLVWDLAPATWAAAKPPGKLDRPRLEALWSDLAGNARNAYHATTELASAGKTAVSFLKQHVRPAAVDMARLRKWIAELDSDRFEIREAASRELARQRFQAEELLLQTLEGKPSLEMRRRVEALLDGPRRPSPEALRTLRAIAVLERIGTPEARRILQTLADGSSTALETRAAATAVRRLR